MKMLTTLALLSQHGPCTGGWRKLLMHVGKDYPENSPIDFATILESNGLDDALWALRAVLPEQEKDRYRLARIFACECAEAVLHIYEKKYPDDKRPREAVRVARDYAAGNTTYSELAAARAAASEAAWAAASEAAWAAASAASEAASAAASAAAWAARAAARAAASEAASAASEAAWAASEAASAAARAAQREIFLRFFCQE